MSLSAKFSNLDEAALKKELGQVIDLAIKNDNIEQLKDVGVYLLGTSGPPASIVHQMLPRFLNGLEELGLEGHREVAVATFNAPRSADATFDEHIRRARHRLADRFSADGDFAVAARILGGMNLDSAALSLEQRFRELVEIIGLFLMDGETVEANLYAQQAMPLQSACEDKATKLQFLVSYARILDSQHKYLEAARRYHSLSLEGSIEEEERLQLLSHAATCIILAEFCGPVKRTMGQIIKDDRVSAVKEFSMLEKMYKEQFIGRREVEEFEEGLSAHQKAITGTGKTPLQRAVLEHNLGAAANVYQSISFSSLGALLGVSEEEAERAASKMIMEGRMQGTIDQSEGFLSFVEDAGAVEAWNSQLSRICSAINECSKRIVAQHPQLAPKL